MIALEKMAKGLPTIVTAFSGSLDYIREEYCLPLERWTWQPSLYQHLSDGGQNADFVPPQDTEGKMFPQEFNFGLDACVDREELREKMVWCYEHQEEAWEIGRKASVYTHAEWGWQNRTRREWMEIWGHWRQIWGL